MDNEVLKRIARIAREELQGAYGYVGVAESTKFVVLNSTDEKGNDIKIEITIAKS